MVLVLCLVKNKFQGQNWTKTVNEQKAVINTGKQKTKMIENSFM